MGLGFKGLGFKVSQNHGVTLEMYELGGFSWASLCLKVDSYSQTRFQQEIACVESTSLFRHAGPFDVGDWTSGPPAKPCTPKRKFCRVSASLALRKPNCGGTWRL